jgi:hypothetical protein
VTISRDEKKNNRKAKITAGYPHLDIHLRKLHVDFSATAENLAPRGSLMKSLKHEKKNEKSAF